MLRRVVCEALGGAPCSRQQCMNRTSPAWVRRGTACSSQCRQPIEQRGMADQLQVRAAAFGEERESGGQLPVAVLPDDRANLVLNLLIGERAQGLSQVRRDGGLDKQISHVLEEINLVRVQVARSCHCW